MENLTAAQLPMMPYDLQLKAYDMFQKRIYARNIIKATKAGLPTQQYLLDQDAFFFGFCIAFQGQYQVPQDWKDSVWNNSAIQPPRDTTKPIATSIVAPIPPAAKTSKNGK